MKTTIALIKQDYARYERSKGLLHFFYRVWRYPAFRILVLFRIMQSGGEIHKVLKCLLMPYYIHLMNKYHIEFPVTVKLGGGCLMPHGGPIIINGNAVIGENTTIHPGVLIGGMRGKGVPVIDDNCFLGNGAKSLAMSMLAIGVLFVRIQLL